MLFQLFPFFGGRGYELEDMKGLGGSEQRCRAQCAARLDCAAVEAGPLSEHSCGESSEGSLGEGRPLGGLCWQLHLPQQHLDTHKAPGPRPGVHSLLIQLAMEVLGRRA